MSETAIQKEVSRMMKIIVGGARDSLVREALVDSLRWANEKGIEEARRRKQWIIGVGYPNWPPGCSSISIDLSGDNTISLIIPVKEVAGKRCKLILEKV